ncbi:hypothetical protein GCM10009037_00320 [Halarchaeum grantii]|uniref:Uncharacterized protein n=1 Tax=Halarchaeum grantii TaxID=1193105 RepID=A0A830F5A2_9EURY|nr:hypothetical protein [Halarchaeum grantii]GGL20960.1 hypothetical protein GCM10009037_00320 [Halarchaeum grantii]
MPLSASRSIGVGLALGTLLGLSVGAVAAVTGAPVSDAGVAVALGVGLGPVLGAALVPVAGWAAGLERATTPLLAAGTLVGLLLGVGASALAWWVGVASLVALGGVALCGGVLGLGLGARHALALA